MGVFELCPTHFEHNRQYFWACSREAADFRLVGGVIGLAGGAPSDIGADPDRIAGRQGPGRGGVIETAGAIPRAQRVGEPDRGLGDDAAARIEALDVNVNRPQDGLGARAAHGPMNPQSVHGLKKIRTAQDQAVAGGDFNPRGQPRRAGERASGRGGWSRSRKADEDES